MWVLGRIDSFRRQQCFVVTKAEAATETEAATEIEAAAR
jgi:hypothetical protein